MKEIARVFDRGKLRAHPQKSFPSRSNIFISLEINKESTITLKKIIRVEVREWWPGEKVIQLGGWGDLASDWLQKLSFISGH